MITWSISWCLISLKLPDRDCREYYPRSRIILCSNWLNALDQLTLTSTNVGGFFPLFSWAMGVIALLNNNMWSIDLSADIFRLPVIGCHEHNPRSQSILYYHLTRHISWSLTEFDWSADQTAERWLRIQSFFIMLWKKSKKI